MQNGNPQLSELKNEATQLLQQYYPLYRMVLNSGRQIRSNLMVRAAVFIAINALDSDNGLNVLQTPNLRRINKLHDSDAHLFLSEFDVPYTLNAFPKGPWVALQYLKRSELKLEDYVDQTINGYSPGGLRKLLSERNSDEKTFREALERMLRFGQAYLQYRSTQVLEEDEALGPDPYAEVGHEDGATYPLWIVDMAEAEAEKGEPSLAITRALLKLSHAVQFNWQKISQRDVFMSSDTSDPDITSLNRRQVATLMEGIGRGSLSMEKIVRLALGNSKNPDAVHDPNVHMLMLGSIHFIYSGLYDVAQSVLGRSYNAQGLGDIHTVVAVNNSLFLTNNFIHAMLEGIGVRLDFPDRKRSATGFAAEQVRRTDEGFTREISHYREIKGLEDKVYFEQLRFYSTIGQAERDASDGLYEDQQLLRRLVKDQDKEGKTDAAIEADAAYIEWMMQLVHTVCKTRMQAHEHQQTPYQSRA